MKIMPCDLPPPLIITHCIIPLINTLLIYLLLIYIYIAHVPKKLCTVCDYPTVFLFFVLVIVTDTHYNREYLY